MSLPFSSLPEHIQIVSVQKQRFSDFLKFQVCSRDAFEIANKVHTRFSILDPFFFFKLQKTESGDKLAIKFGKGWIFAKRFREIPIRFNITTTEIDEPITPEFCQLLTEFFLTTHSTSHELVVKSVNCSPELWNRLLDPLNLQKFTCYDPISPELLLVPAIKKVTDLHATSSLTNEEILTLQMSSINLYNTNVTSVGINLILKEWTNGARNIDYVKMRTSSKLQKYAIFRGISNANLLEGYILKRAKDEKIAVSFPTTGFNEIEIHKSS